MLRVRVLLEFIFFPSVAIANVSICVVSIINYEASSSSRLLSTYLRSSTLRVRFPLKEVLFLRFCSNNFLYS
jgi:hypothetical protein